MEGAAPSQPDEFSDMGPISVPPYAAAAYKCYLDARNTIEHILGLMWKRRVIQLALAQPTMFSKQDIGKFRDPEWEKLERPFLDIAMKILNDSRRPWNEIASIKLDEVQLDEVLEKVVKNSVFDIQRNLPNLSGVKVNSRGTDERHATPVNDKQSSPVYLPLKTAGCCSVCRRTDSLRLCSACKERVYCSAECQKRDWVNHKSRCGKTDYLNFKKFYPFIATVVDVLRLAPERRPHPATLYQITNSPNPPHHRPRIIKLGDPCLTSGKQHWEEWWPTAKSMGIAGMLYRRINREGWLVPLYTATCFSLLSQIYTTTWTPKASSPDGHNHLRTRFHYGGSPVADFGIVKGALDVPLDGARTYVDKDGNLLPRLQDPREHYWIYITTLSGEDLAFDCGLYSYDHTSTVIATYYALEEFPLAWPNVPVILEDKGARRFAFSVHRENKRYSVLRNPDLHQAIKVGTEDPRILWSFMDQVAGRECSEMERYLGRIWTYRACNALTTTMGRRSWLDWPETPRYIIEDEQTGLPGVLPSEHEINCDKQWMKEVAKINRRYKKGKMTGEEMAKAYTESTTRSKTRPECKRS